MTVNRIFVQFFFENFHCDFNITQSLWLKYILWLNTLRRMVKYTQTHEVYSVSLLLTVQSLILLLLSYESTAVDAFCLEKIKAHKYSTFQ